MPLECLFKGGDAVQPGLAADLAELRAGGALGDMRWLTVATSPSGSYNSDDVYDFLDRHLEPWTDGRDWRLLHCDAYKPHIATRLVDLCWSRGYILLLHGGGTTGVAQVNDTHLHHALSLDYQGLEMGFLARLMELAPRELPTPSRADCLRMVASVWAQPSLHVRAAAGAAANMIRAPLDGSGDHMGEGDAARLWRELGMDAVRLQLLAAVDSEHASGRLPWNQASVQSLLDSFPLRGELDFYEPGQEDEGTLVGDDGGAPAWDVGGPVGESGSDVDAPEGARDSGFRAPVDAALAAAAQPLIDDLAQLDRMREHAAELGDMRILRIVDRVRQ